MFCAGLNARTAVAAARFSENNWRQNARVAQFADGSRPIADLYRRRKRILQRPRAYEFDVELTPGVQKALLSLCEEFNLNRTDLGF